MNLSIKAICSNYSMSNLHNICNVHYVYVLCIATWFFVSNKSVYKVSNVKKNYIISINLSLLNINLFEIMRMEFNEEKNFYFI